MTPHRYHYSNKGFNELVREVQRNTPLPGINSTVRQLGNYGTSVDFISDEFVHPWFIRPFWDDDAGGWCVSIDPGFVNGRDPVIEMNSSLVPFGSKVFGNQYGKSGIKTGPGTNTTIEVLLTDTFQDSIQRPFIKLAGYFDRAANDDSGDTVKTGTYPFYFTGLGARRPDPLSFLLSGDGEGGIQLGGTVTDTVISNFDNHAVTPSSFGNKQIASTDIVLHVDRPAVKIDPAVPQGGLNNMFLTEVSIDPAPDRYNARIFSIAKWMPPIDPSLEDARIFGTVYEELNFDELVIGTVYYLSPEGGKFPVDETWQTYVQHSVFWNLNYASVNIIDAPVDTNVTLFTGLVGGIFDAFFNQLLAPINEANAQISAALNASTMKGYFWTC